MTTVNNMVLYTWNILRAYLKHSHYKKQKRKELTKWGDGCIRYLDLGNHSTIYVYQIGILYTLIYTIIFVNYICYSSIKLEKYVHINAYIINTIYLHI